MSTTAPTAEELLQEFLSDLQKRDITLDDQARAALEKEFRRRLSQSSNRDETLMIWDQNRARYADLLDSIAGRKRAARAIPDGAPTVLEEQDVKASFPTCSRLCPGPA
jgi:hypothetical protein